MDLEDAIALTTLTVQTGENGRRTEHFTGFWVILPSDDMRSVDEGADAGTNYGVAVTANDRVAVYTSHVGDRFDPCLSSYDDIEEAVDQGRLPRDIADEFRGRSGLVIIRDI